MNNAMEQYLSQVERHMKQLPEKRRKCELLEIRQHLHLAIAANQKLGLSEEDAVAHAVKSFGSPKEVAGNIVDAWIRQDNVKRRRISWIAVLVIAVCISADPHRSVYNSSSLIFSNLNLYLIMYYNYWGQRYKARDGRYKVRPLGSIFCSVLTVYAVAFLYIQIRYQSPPLLNIRDMVTVLIAFLTPCGAWLAHINLRHSDAIESKKARNP